MNKFTVSALLAFIFASSVFAANPIKIACVGNSITYGASIANREANSYPAQLQAFLGDGYEVRNFGVSATTLLTDGNFPYITTPEYEQSKEYAPDMVIIKFGTNDSKPGNREHLDKFVDNYTQLIRSYVELPSHPQVILLTPIRCYLPEGSDIDSSIIINRIVPLVKETAQINGADLIDMYEVFGPDYDSSLLPDRLHPSSIGAGMMAREIGRYILHKSGKDIANYCTHAVPGNEYRSAAGWIEGSEWHSVAADIKNSLEGRNLKLLLLGNSITQGWGGDRERVSYKPGKKALDSAIGEGTWETAGISGDRTQNLLWRVKHGNYNRCQPGTVIIAIGINNLIAGDTPDDTAEGIMAVAHETRAQFPDSRIVLLGLLPSGQLPDSHIRKKYNAVQQRLASHSFENIEYVDPTEWFLDSDGRIADGLYSGDYIHLTQHGYALLASKIAGMMK